MAERQTVELDGVQIAYEANGRESAPLLLCLHGFPESRSAWADVAQRLSDRFRVIRPDQRGYGDSASPADVDAYRVARLREDMFGLMEAIAPGRSFFLAGHDWGASIAYAMTFKAPEKIDALVVANGPHPIAYQRAILDNPRQRKASQYVRDLRAPDAEERLAANYFEHLFAMMETFSSSDFLDDPQKARLREDWSRDGAITGMLNWYRASPLVVPEPDEDVSSAPLLDLDPETATVRVPHLVVWGEEDSALRKSVLEGLDEFADDLCVIRVPGAGHWVLHEQPGKVAELVAAFCKDHMPKA